MNKTTRGLVIVLGMLGAAAGLSGCGEMQAAGKVGPRASEAVRVTGTTLEAATGEVLAGVVVEGPGEVRAVSDAAGRFTLSGLAPGDAGVLRAHHPDGLSGELPLPALGEGRREVVLYLRPVGE